MSLRARIEDAVFLWEHGHREGAFLSALVAVAATARRRFPDRKTIGDRDAFERFLSTAHSVRLSVEYRGETHTIEHIFYKWLRCELVHEGGLPIDIEFMPDPELGALSVRAGGAPNYILKLSNGWFKHLVGAVVAAPENAVEFKQCQSTKEIGEADPASVESRCGAVVVDQAYPFPPLSSGGASRAQSCPVSTPRSSNRTCGFPASGSRTKRHAFAHGRPCVRIRSRTSRRSS